MPHLLVDISSHGFGHLAQTAPILTELRQRMQGVEITIRSGLPRAKLEERLSFCFRHVEAATDFGFVMRDPFKVDLDASARRYFEQHACWSERVDAEALWLRRHGVDFVLSNVSYLPLAGAAKAGIGAAACCSLNWHALFNHYFRPPAADARINEIAAQMRAAYAGAPFLALTPAMAMPELPQVVPIGAVAETGRNRRAQIVEKFPEWREKRLVLVGFGGIPMGERAYPLARWAAQMARAGLPCVWLVPDEGETFPGAFRSSRLGLSYLDLQASCDAIIGKPGYGTFVEAAVAGTPLLWIRREDWPEQECLVNWLSAIGNARELAASDPSGDGFSSALSELWRSPPVRVGAPGAAEAAEWLVARLQ